jgi:hypothetical protein
MPRKPNVDRPIRTEINVPESLRTRIDLLLFSTTEGRVPHGKLSEFFCEAVKEKLERIKG